MKTFQNKTVLITGGTSGIGKATALAFAKEGANVVVSGRRVAEGEKVAREITSAGGSALFVQTDVAREDDIVARVEKTVGAFGALHIAFNNAGTEGQFGLLTTEQTVEHYHQVCDTNIRGVLLSMKHEIPAILRSGGAIVNNSSVGGHIGFPGASVYVASKFAVIGLTKTAALEFAKQASASTVSLPARSRPKCSTGPSRPTWITGPITAINIGTVQPRLCSRNPSDPPSTMARLSSSSTQATPGPWIQGPILRTSIAATVRPTRKGNRE
jgi:NAD(P)-dependent dehydrogenase (short-subunit alcohol dehydrogenase family)